MKKVLLTGVSVLLLATIPLSASKAKNTGNARIPISLSHKTKTDIGSINAYIGKSFTNSASGSSSYYHDNTDTTGTNTVDNNSYVTDMEAEDKALEDSAKEFAIGAGQALLETGLSAGFSEFLGPAGEAIGGPAATFILSCFGLGGMDPQYQAIMNKLNEIQEQLDTIDEHLTDLTKNVDRLTLYNAFDEKRKEARDVYYQATVTWNTITDARWMAALYYKFGENFRNSEEFRKSAPYQKTVFLAKLSKDNGYLDFLKDENNEYNKLQNQQITDAVKKWGDSGYAINFLSLCDFLTSQEIGKVGKEKLNMFQLYDVLAVYGYTWEREGYDWRNLERDGDCALMAKAGMLAYAYFSITEPSGTASNNCRLINDSLRKMQEMVKNYPVEIHTTPICQIYPDNIIIFEEKLHEIKYGNLLDRCYSSWHWECDEGGVFDRPGRSTNYSGYVAERLYAGKEPVIETHGIVKDKHYKDMNKGLTLDEKFWSKVWDNYKDESPHPTMLQILQRAGFSNAVIVRDVDWKETHKPDQNGIVYPDSKHVHSKDFSVDCNEYVTFTETEVTYDDLFEDNWDDKNKKIILSKRKKHGATTWTWKRKKGGDEGNHYSLYATGIAGNSSAAALTSDRQDGWEIIRFLNNHGGPRVVDYIYRDYNGDNAEREKRGDLKMKDRGGDFEVANTHLFFYPVVTDKEK